MKILTNRYFILGNLLLLLISIPLTLFFIKRQQELRSRAAPSSKLTFSPENVNTSTQCQNFNVDIMLDPSSNIVSIVDFYLKYDPTKLDVLQIKESDSFSTVVRPVSVSSGEANMSVSVGADVTRAVQVVSKVAPVTFRPKAAGSAQISFDSEKSRVFSLAPADEPTENVLFQVSTANVTIGSDACTTGGTVTPTVTPTGTQPTGTISPTSAPTTVPTGTANQAPLCTELSVSPSVTGSAPFSVSLTAKGNDPDAAGTLTKASFNFGDGSIQDITEGLGQKSATIQTNHTYQSAGTFGATAVFTDNGGKISTACTQTITATAAGSATTAPPPGQSPTGAAPTPTGTSSGQLTPTSTLTSSPTAVPTTAPTVPPPGEVAKTIGIIGAIILTIVAGLALLAL